MSFVFPSTTDRAPARSPFGRHLAGGGRAVSPCDVIRVKLPIIAGLPPNRDRAAWLDPRKPAISEHRNPWEETMTDDAAWPLARHVCCTGYADLPASAVEAARRDILDTFGCMLGGSGSPGIEELFAVIARWGGREESRVLLRGTRLPAPQAALLNASMGHALDFDDTLDTGGSIHPGVSVLGSVLAVCDSLALGYGRGQRSHRVAREAACQNSARDQVPRLRA
jgi:hypothetical protein